MQLWTGESQDTLTNQAVTAATGSPTAGRIADFGTDLINPGGVIGSAGKAPQLALAGTNGLSLAADAEKARELAKFGSDLSKFGGRTDALAKAAKQCGNGGSASNPHLEGKTPMPGSRGTGVNRAKQAEVDLVQRTGKGTTNWTPSEIEHIQRTGTLPDGTVGHHINSVNDFPEWQGDPRNVRLLRGQADNLAEHGGNFQNGTTGPLIDR